MNSIANSTAKTGKFITFKAAGYWFALPMNAVLRIVSYPSSDKGDIADLGLVQLGLHTVQLLDLDRIFGTGRAAVSPNQPPFLLVLREPQEQLWGIALESPPDLSELPIEAFQAILVDDRFAPKQQWISHVAVVAEGPMSQPLLQLNLGSVLAHEAASRETAMLSAESAETDF